MANPKANKTRDIPKGLSDEEKANIVEEYLGVHPRYFVYQHGQISINTWVMEHDGKLYSGWTPHKKELGII